MAEKDRLLRELDKHLDQLMISREPGREKRHIKKMLQADDGAQKLHSREIKVTFLS